MAQSTANESQHGEDPKGAAAAHGADAHAAHHAEGHDHPPFLAHHFDTPEHQFDAGKMGIWLFLTTEILFFGGLFCAYAIYRSLHPEVFEYAHYYLNTTWGAVNTCVLIVSSLTAAWAVRNAQLGEQKKLVVNIIITILCAFTFMGVKYVEYSHKFKEGLLWESKFNPTEEAWELESYKAHHGPGEPADKLKHGESAQQLGDHERAEQSEAATTAGGKAEATGASHKL
ncbi:MAG TPA: cytochrome c oxidase subunit 3, partial [Polyangiaceae bacterium]|nr:cytochrome c oxidase subunit 3 [Polyangiaceae bacterium]